MAVKAQYCCLPPICREEDGRRRTKNALPHFHNTITSLTGFSSPRMVYIARGARHFRVSLMAKKGSSSENPQTQLPISPLRAPKLLVARSAVVLFALGFIDAGYSGDWSRIGVITRETEELLKIAAFLVVPLCLFLIFALSDQDAASK